MHPRIGKGFFPSRTKNFFNDLYGQKIPLGTVESVETSSTKITLGYSFFSEVINVSEAKLSKLLKLSNHQKNRYLQWRYSPIAVCKGKPGRKIA